MFGWKGKYTLVCVISEAMYKFGTCSILFFGALIMFYALRLCTVFIKTFCCGALQLQNQKISWGFTKDFCSDCLSQWGMVYSTANHTQHNKQNTS